MAKAPNSLFCMIAGYDSALEAQADLESLRERCRDYDAALFTQAEKSKIDAGILWPSKISGDPGFSGQLEDVVGRRELREVGELLESSDAAVIVVAESSIERTLRRQLKLATKKRGRRAARMRELEPV